MYKIYKILTALSSPLLISILNKRCKAGKELPNRVQEKKSEISRLRPLGKLLWIHAASIGEAQSALIIIDKLIEHNKKLNILVTTGTVTSAKIMNDKLPQQAFHQFYPLDHPTWTKKFINHWKPDGVIWLESELWPNMLYEIKKKNIPALLVNARMSDKSYSTWKRLKPLAKSTLATFNKILCQTEIDRQYFTQLGAHNVIVTNNLKYSALNLSHNEENLKLLENTCSNRNIWLYASSHKGEEALACKTHIELKKQFPNLLTIIVPRHPERREKIKETCKEFDLNITFRGTEKTLPKKNDDIYIADTLGELGLFYRLSPLTCIGRSFSDDGGGGHNPIEAAQLGCAVIHGKNVQNLQMIFKEMDNANSAICMQTPKDLIPTINMLLGDASKLKQLQNSGIEYAKNKRYVIEKVMSEIKPTLRTLDAN